MGWGGVLVAWGGGGQLYVPCHLSFCQFVGRLALDYGPMYTAQSGGQSVRTGRRTILMKMLRCVSSLLLIP
jgi:hypothetical protein